MEAIEEKLKQLVEDVRRETVQTIVNGMRERAPDWRGIDGEQTSLFIAYALESAVQSHFGVKNEKVLNLFKPHPTPQ